MKNKTLKSFLKWKLDFDTAMQIKPEYSEKVWDSIRKEPLYVIYGIQNISTQIFARY